jgi:hypothetical protein
MPREDGVVSDDREGEELAARVVVRAFLARHESSVADGDADRVDAIGGVQVDVGLNDVAPVALLEEQTAFEVAEDLAE